MINAGVPIIQSLEILFKGEKNIVLKKTIKVIAREVAEGKTVAESMFKQKGFTRLYCNLIKAGEAGGILDEILNKLAEFMDRQEKVKRQVKSALTYPTIVTLVGIGVIWAMLTFVVPQFVGMLKDTGQQVPAITQFVIDLSAFVDQYSLVGVPGFFLILIFLLYPYRSNK